MGQRHNRNRYLSRSTCRSCRGGGGISEYCQLPQSLSSIPFEIDHIIARKHNGPTDEANLALSCFYCNSYKGPNIAGIDPATGQITRLYNPRNDLWRIHFDWNGPILFGLTDVGRATITVLAINHSDAVAFRKALIEEGISPPW